MALENVMRVDNGNIIGGVDGGSKNFQGTIAEWNQLSTAEKKAYDHASIPDSIDGGVTFPANKVVLTGGGNVEDALNELTKYVNFASGATVNVTGSVCLLIAKRTDSVTSYTVNAVALCAHGNMLYLVNSGGNTTPLSASYSNGVTTITNANAVAVHLGVVVLNN